ncbi:uncharacterized protein LAESUDRAFT_684617 [Laetiporus sulphureus 93-53]|uniref:Uncharacterized protein n=1 Tax=Laetiporus sulphureus 93-53 TaxID=1314785 RepID=A0A165CGV6_9APHY|nr:uncharacterized protein LAESUDRAFT_684617 [Laetiporus sulphureus 93-53]KZT02783.1 hypothetical protein LAESUDRAFT_684617 [Laetiporus sulphureus 93-53]
MLTSRREYATQTGARGRLCLQDCGIMSGVPVLSANLATAVMESLFYGIFLVLSFFSMYILQYRRSQVSSLPPNPRATRNMVYLTPMSIAAVCLLITNTAHWIIMVYRLFQAFLYYEKGTQPVEFYKDASQPSEVTQTAVLMISLIIGDAMIIYRLWIVSGYNWYIAIFPSSTLVGLAVCTVGSIYELTRSRAGGDIFFAPTGHWITANCVFTLCTNVYSTAMIACKIWHANKEAKRFGGSSLMGVTGILVESAALYTAWTILFFVTYSIQSNLQSTCSETYCAVAGIAFMLINVRVGMGWAQRAHVSPVDMDASREAAQESFGMTRRVAINVTRVVHTDDGTGGPIKFKSSSSLDLP